MTPLTPAQVEALIERLQIFNRYDQIYADRICMEAASALAALHDENVVKQELVDAVIYALKSSCFFPVSEPSTDASTEEWIKWGAMRNLHTAVAKLTRKGLT